MIKHFLRFSTSSKTFRTMVATSVLSTGVLTSGCTKQGFNSFVSSITSSEIISNRQQTPGNVIVLIKLQNPALLTSIKNENGTKLVDSDLKSAIIQEQSSMIETLKGISSEIRVLYSYKMVLNGLAVVAPSSVLDKLKALGGVSYVEGEGFFSRPSVSVSKSKAKRYAEEAPAYDFKNANSAKFIGAEIVHQMRVKNKDGVEVALDGTGMRIGIIDTGIDYTHAMMKGAGTEEAYLSIDPSKPNEAFPNEKVIGGIDLVGTDYDSASVDIKRKIPVPDANPLDEGGHGSHVAGSVAGLGDGINTYDGVAPGAKLYAIKVFGADGSTGDAVVVAGLEYAADPTGKGDPSQQLDAVNLSLGSSYGSSHILYQEAIRNLTNGGTIVLASAGNSGPEDNIVGSPSVSDEAFSIAASVDNGLQNWQFPAVKFLMPTHKVLVVEAMESPIAKPLSESDVRGPLVFVGTANSDFPSDVAAKLKGNVALIDRGQVAFADKIRRAQDVGAIGVVVANNQPGDPFKMGGDGRFDIPAIMISQGLGDEIKNQMKSGDVVIQFKNPEKIERKELIDTITAFSSKGPRSFDSAIKPEISSPGLNVVSAEKGGGNKGVEMSGTSMAAPHMSGAMALLKQLHPDLSVAELKAIAMETAKSIQDATGSEYAVSMQGAGRIQLEKAVLAKAVALPSGISLGEQNIASRKIVSTSLLVKNISSSRLTFAPSFKSRVSGISMMSALPLDLAAGATGAINLRFILDVTSKSDSVIELDGFLSLKTGSEADLTLPVLAVVKKISNIKSSEMLVYSSEQDAAGAAVDLKVKNSGQNVGDALVFNLIGLNDRKANPTRSDSVDTSCNLQAAGYRIIKKNINGVMKPVLQVAAKLYQPETTWHQCEISVLIDKEGNGVPTQELAGIAASNLPGLALKGNPFLSILLDAGKVRSLRKRYELISQNSPKRLQEDYRAAIVDANEMIASPHTSVAVVEAPVDELSATESGELSIRVGTINDKTTVAMDDFLESASQWLRISLQEESQSFSGMPEKISLNPGQEQTVSLKAGFDTKPALLLFPQNANVFSDMVKDGQAQIVKPKFAN